MSKTKRENNYKKLFKSIIIKYILPLLPHKEDSKIRNCREIKKKYTEYAIYDEKNNTCTIVPRLNYPDFAFEITTIAEPNLGVVRSILSEILNVSRFDFKSGTYRSHTRSGLKVIGKYVYQEACYDLAFEIGMCYWLGGVPVYRLLEKMQQWAFKTYEGHNVPFGFIIDVNNSNKGGNKTNSNYIHFLDNHYSATFTDGINTGIALDYSGRIINYFKVTDSTTGKYKNIVPFEIESFAERCRSSKKDNRQWIGIVALKTREILIIKSQQLVFAKRNGKWTYYNNNYIWSIIREYLNNDSGDAFDKAQELYLSLLDLSFSHIGGCIGIVSDDMLNDAKECFKKDILGSDEFIDEDITMDRSKREIIKEKKKIINEIISSSAEPNNKNFFEMDRKLRMELLSMDGAVVLNSKGTIQCAGAIIDAGGGSSGGGRTQATQKLANFGLAIKVSEDGFIEGYKSAEKGIKQCFCIK